MNRVSPILHGVQLVLIVVLFYLVLTKPASPVVDGSQQALIENLAADSLGGLFVVNFDSLQTHYTYYKETQQALKEQFTQFQVRLQQRQQNLATEFEQFQQDVAKFQQNPALQTNAEIARLQAKEQDLINKRQQLEVYTKNGEEQFAAATTEKSREVAKRIEDYLAGLNAAGRFKVVMSSGEGTGLLYVYPGLDITQEVVAGLNAEYAKQTGREPK